MRRLHVLQAIGLALALIASVYFIVTSGVPDYTASELTTTKVRFDTAPRPAPTAVTAWYVAPDENRVVMVVRPGHQRDGKAFLKAAGAEERHVAIEVSAEIPKLYDDIRGGEAVRVGDGRCSVGFAVESGFVTAGHCGKEGTAVSGANGREIGSIDRTAFPQRDAAVVKASPEWTPKAAVSRHDEGGEVEVAGSQEADVDAEVCRSGSTTGWKCGRILAKNQTVNFEQTTITGLTKTDVCAEPGDSGGPFITPDGQAQGITSGGSGDCSSGGTTFFQPLNPALSELGATLLTNGGGPDPSPTCGPTNSPGPSGPTGPSGPSGPTGPTGPSGPPESPSPAPSVGLLDESTETGSFFGNGIPEPEPTSTIWDPITGPAGPEDPSTEPPGPPGPPGSIPPEPPSTEPPGTEPSSTEPPGTGPPTTEPSPGPTDDPSPGPTGDPSPSPAPTTPCTPGPTSPGPTNPGPSSPGPTDPGPTSPGPTSPGPTNPGPTSPGPTEPGPTSPGPTAPAPPNTCDTSGERVTGSVRLGRWDEQPGGQLQRFADGEFRGCLDPPDNDNFDLYLMKWSKTKWKVVATGRKSGPHRLVSYGGNEGYYVWMIVPRSGGGTYTLHMKNP